MGEEEGRAGLRELARFPDVMVVSSSAGWTDQKHMLYLGLLQESFVSQLHGGEIGFRGLFDLSRGASGPEQPSKADGGKAWVKAEQARPPCCGVQQGDGETVSMEEEEEDDDASSAETTVRESSSQGSAASSGRSPPSTAEGSDQNFIDDDTITRENGESRGRRRSNKRLKAC